MRRENDIRRDESSGAAAQPERAVLLSKCTDRDRRAGKFVLSPHEGASFDGLRLADLQRESRCDDPCGKTPAGTAFLFWRRNGEVLHGGNPNSDHKKSISKRRGWVPDEVGAHRVAS